MRHCKLCCEPDTRPGQVFNEDGICTPCTHMATSTAEDWEARREELRGIVEWAKERRSPMGYDSIIGVSGGKDSTRLALYARSIGLNPLLVSMTYPPQQQTDLGAHNLGNLIRQGFDVITINIAPETYKHAIRTSFFKFSNWVNPSEIALYSSIPRTALQYGIPLACAGENPFLTMGNGSGSTDGNAINIISLNTLRGGDLTPFLDDVNKPEDMLLYVFPEKERMLNADLRMIYLGYYIEDYEPHTNARIAVEHGMHVREGVEADPARTGYIHNHTMLDEDFVIVNQFLKYVKLGFGMTTQQASQDIREGLMTRDEAVDLVRKYDGRIDNSYVKRFCRYLEISEDDFWAQVENCRNRDIWELVDNKWQLKNPLRKSDEQTEMTSRSARAQAPTESAAR